METISKGRAGQIGEIRTWAGKKYQKTAKGWRPVAGGGNKGTKAPDAKEKSEERKTVLDSLGKDIKMINGVNDVLRLSQGTLRDGKIVEPGHLLVALACDVESAESGARKFYDVLKYVKDAKPKIEDYIKEKGSSNSYDEFIRDSFSDVEKVLDFALNEKAQKFHKLERDIHRVKQLGWNMNDRSGIASLEIGIGTASIRFLSENDGCYKGEYNVSGHSVPLYGSADEITSAMHYFKDVVSKD